MRNPEVVALRKKVSVTTDPAIHADECYLTVRTVDGRTYTKHVLHAIGSLERPMTDAELDEKYRGLVAGILPEAQAAKLLELCWKLESLSDISVIPKTGAAIA